MKSEKNKFYKKLIAIFMATSMLFAVCAAGCSNDNQGGTNNTKSITETPSSSFEYSERDDGLTISKFIGDETEVNIPSSINGKSVTKIGESAFENCTGLINVIIPDSVVYIGLDAFSGCSSLTSVTISVNMEVIGEGAFKACDNLPNITIPDSVTTINNYAFYNCPNLTSITIPDSVTSIGTRVFTGCNQLTISGKSGSTAESYAKDNKIPFNAI